MRTKHLVKRGEIYHFICRIPSDILHLFPSPVVSRSLKTDSKKHAGLLGVAYEQKTQQLFAQLRSGMFDATLQRLLINLFLRDRLDTLESIATGQATSKAAAGDIAINESIIKEHETRKGITLSDAEKQDMRATIASKMAGHDKAALKDRGAWMYDGYVDRLAKSLKTEHGVTITSAQKKALAVQFTNASHKAHEAEAGIHRGEWSLYETLRGQVDTALSQPYYLFADVLDKYAAWYTASKPNIAAGTLEDMQVECRVLLEIIGNISIAEVNSMTTVTELKTVLRKYPLNRVQKFPGKSLAAILRSEKGYPKIGPKTANEYLKRLKAVLDHANKSKMLNAANVAVGELFRTEVAAEDQRESYDDTDIARLVDAICTQPLWGYGEPKPERFWLILIALFHGFRLGNIVGLTKADICQTDRGTWVFMLRRGKRKATVRPVAICDSLLLLGFLEWVQSLAREKLFQDSSASFSAWYNRNEVRSDGYNVQGFETKYVTDNKRKCLYSLRHAFAGNVFDVSSDFKITADMLGHSTGKSVTARYTKRTKAETLKELTDKLHLGHIDLDRLEARAMKLFGHM